MFWGMFAFVQMNVCDKTLPDMSFLALAPLIIQALFLHHIPWVRPDWFPEVSYSARLCLPPWGLCERVFCQTPVLVLIQDKLSFLVEFVLVIKRDLKQFLYREAQYILDMDLNFRICPGIQTLVESMGALIMCVMSIVSSLEQGWCYLYTHIRTLALHCGS